MCEKTENQTDSQVFCQTVDGFSVAKDPKNYDVFWSENESILSFVQKFEESNRESSFFVKRLLLFF